MTQDYHDQPQPRTTWRIEGSIELTADRLAPVYKLINEVAERYVQERIADAFRQAGLEPPAAALAAEQAAKSRQEREPRI